MSGNPLGPGGRNLRLLSYVDMRCTTGIDNKSSYVAVPSQLVCVMIEEFSMWY